MTELETIQEKQEQLRDILINNNCPEYGDSIIDSICELFEYPNTNAV